MKALATDFADCNKDEENPFNNHKTNRWENQPCKNPKAKCTAQKRPEFIMKPHGYAS